MDGHIDYSSTSESDSSGSQIPVPSNFAGTTTTTLNPQNPHSSYYQPLYSYLQHQPQQHLQQTALTFQGVGQLGAGTGIYQQIDSSVPGTTTTNNVPIYGDQHQPSPHQQVFRPYMNIMDTSSQHLNQMQAQQMHNQVGLGGVYQGYFDPYYQYYNAMPVHGGIGMQQNANVMRQFEMDHNRVSNLPAENIGATRNTSVPQSSQVQGRESRRRKNLSIAERHLEAVKRRKRNRHVSRKLHDEQLHMTVESNSTSILEAGVDANVANITWSDLHLSKETQDSLLSLLPLDKQADCLKFTNVTDLLATFMPFFNKDDLTENQKDSLAQFRAKLRTAKKSQREKVKRLQINGMLNKIGPHIEIDAAKTDMFTILSLAYEKLLELAEYKVNCTCCSVWKRRKY